MPALRASNARTRRGSSRSPLPRVRAPRDKADSHSETHLRACLLARAERLLRLVLTAGLTVAALGGSYVSAEPWGPFAPFCRLRCSTCSICSICLNSTSPIIQAYLLLRLVYGERWAAAPGAAMALHAYCALVAALALNGTAEARFRGNPFSCTLSRWSFVSLKRWRVSRTSLGCGTCCDAPH